MKSSGSSRSAGNIAKNASSNYARVNPNLSSTMRLNNVQFVNCASFTTSHATYPNISGANTSICLLPKLYTSICGEILQIACSHLYQNRVKSCYGGSLSNVPSVCPIAY